MSDSDLNQKLDDFIGEMKERYDSLDKQELALLSLAYCKGYHDGLLAGREIVDKTIKRWYGNIL